MTVPPLANDPPDWDALARFHAGESVGDEARRVGAWLEAHPADAEMLAALNRVLSPSADAAGGEPLDVEAALRAVRARLRDEQAARVIPFPGARATSSPARPVRRWVAGGVAAAAAIAALAVGLGRARVAPRGEVALATRGAPGSEIVTGVGVRDSVRLPDGTRVILAPASRLAVSPAYGRGSREVTLQGMAWLAVHHDGAVPFTVRVGGAVVRDVGTAFTVRTDGTDGRAVSVAVTDGRVELRGGAASSAAVTLAAGDRGHVDADGQAIAERGRASDEDVSWTQGRLVFRETPMAQVRADIRRWYGVELRLADSSLVARRITATFEGEPVDRVLEVVALALGARVERHDSVAVLRPGPMR